MRQNSRNMAFGGMMAALAVVIMAMGTLIPVATFFCPVLCMLLLRFVLMSCGSKVAWAWYAAVAILSLILAPDKEAAVIFAFLGYYPIVKPAFERSKLGFLWKFLLFNIVILTLYGLMMKLVGMDALAAEYEDMGLVMNGVLLAMGNITFFLLDRLLSMRPRRKNRG